MITIEQGAPNLDGAFPDDIWDVAERLARNKRKLGRIMFPDAPKGYVTATGNLAHYAYNKATAMRCRERGDILAAQNYEAICDRIYDQLPSFAKW